MNFIHFEPNKPQTFIFPASEPLQAPDGSFSLYPLPTGELLYLAPSLMASLALLKLQPGEEFTIGLYYDRGSPHWVTSLSPATEKARALREMESADLEARLAASIRLVEGRKVANLGGGSHVPFLAPTGTEGPGAIPVPSPRKAPAIAAVAAGGRKRGELIPYNVAFREIVAFVVAELKASGEQWSDQCRQDLISTALISAQKLGVLGVWEREDAA